MRESRGDTTLEVANVHKWLSNTCASDEIKSEQFIFEFNLIASCLKINITNNIFVSDKSCIQNYSAVELNINCCIKEHLAKNKK